VSERRGEERRGEVKKRRVREMERSGEGFIGVEGME
jgi:hypothetical protein